MRKPLWLIVVVGLAALAAGVALYPQAREAGSVEMPAAVAFRVLLGTGDAEPAQWDGTVTVTPGRIVSIQGWRFRGEDSTDGRSSWKAWSGRSFVMIGRQYAGQAPPTLENGVIIAASADDARFNIKTQQGGFSFSAGEIPFGVRKTFLGGRVAVDRVPASVQLTASLEDQDFPAVAHAPDAVWVSYVEFVRGDRAQHRWGQMGEDPPKDLSFVSRPAGGDRVWLLRFDKARRTWGAPIAVTGAGEDVMKTAVAVDGQKRVWVFWSANRKGNFDIYARAWSGRRWGPEVRITADEGTDINPVAAADSAGRVWVAWQGFRGNNLEVLASVQKGEAFGQPAVVSVSKASDWDPSIAAGANGEVAVAWDTYDKGDYDVWVRRMRLEGEIRMEAPAPVAASTGFEARSSIAYDRQNRLWVAWETSDAKWGKDNGPYDRAGIPLYRNHNVAVKCFQGSQVYQAQPEKLSALLPRAAGPAPAAKKQPARKKQADEHETAPRSGVQSLNSFPRLAVDPAGYVYLAFRTRMMPGRSNAGTVWAEQLVYFDGAEWKGPVFVPHADQWIENRPALAPLGPGHLMMITASDHRQEETLRDRRPGGRRAGEPLPDAVNVDLYASEMRIGAPAQPAQLAQAAPETVAAPDGEAGAESGQIARMRNHRVSIGTRQMRLLRGEFHRHTDTSVDGNGDGPLIDAYRYMIDAAAMDWGGCCDHDNGAGEYPWWLQQKLTDAYKLGERYVSIFSYERSVNFPEGHRNVVFEQRGIRPLPRLPKVANDSEGHAPDTLMLYEYLRRYDGIVASHTSGTDMGTDWRDNDPVIEPVVEIYQGCRQNYEMPGAPRSNTAENSIGGWRPLGFVSLALKKGYRLGFQSSSDHGSTHISYCNLWVSKPTREGIMEAFHKRRVYGATDNILAEVRSGEHFMGEEFTVSQPPPISVKLVGTAEFAKVHIVKDGEYVYSVEPRKREVDFTWRDEAAVRGKTSYYYVRGEQADGELVWASPMWITYR